MRLALPPGLPPPRQVRRQTWIARRCGGCGRDVMFLPRQRRNTCAWCGRAVRRGLV